jgi:hypothetical protein
MATIKHISSKNADYGAAEAYLTFEHDVFTMKPTLDEAGRLIPRQDYRMDTLNCGRKILPCHVSGQICGTARTANGRTLRATTISSALTHGTQPTMD